MTCYAPLIGYFSDERTVNGKRGIVFSPPASFSGLPLKLPCGQCVGCRLEKSRQWAVRCMHEASMHEDNCFLTLTYDDDNIPDGHTLVKRDLQLFFKRLRKARDGQRIRYYACGEYGECTFRPHYHILLFGCDFFDGRMRKQSDSGELVRYDSSELWELWRYGQHSIGGVTFESAAYCARYAMKKRTGPGSDEYYGGRQPEFSLMSRRPGIGADWLAKYGRDVYRHDSVICRGVECKPPRYYDIRWTAEDESRIEQVLRARARDAIGRQYENTLDRRRVRESCAIVRNGLYKRDAV